MKTALTIAGSDSGGGAGIQADLKTYSAHGVFGMSVLTAVTAQNTKGVTGVEALSPKIIGLQLDAIFADLPVDSVKIGMVSNREAISVIAEKLRRHHPVPIILDPVMISKSGHSLLEEEAQDALINQLLPLASLVTPNLPEASVLIGEAVQTLDDMEHAARLILEQGPQAVLVKGGHLEGEPVDVLFDGKQFYHLKGKRIPSRHTHGTGCTLSSAIAANLAQGNSLLNAVQAAKDYVQLAIAHAPGLGSGSGPLHHFHQWFAKEGGVIHD